MVAIFNYNLSYDNLRVCCDEPCKLTCDYLNSCMTSVSHDVRTQDNVMTCLTTVFKTFCKLGPNFFILYHFAVFVNF